MPKGRKCKCKFCGKEINTLSSYKIKEGNTNKYFCNEKEYTGFIEQKKKETIETSDKDAVYEKIYDIFGRRLTNTALYKEVAEWRNSYSYRIIYGYLRDNEAYLQRVMNRDFNSIYGKIKYFSTIVKNSLDDYESIEEEDDFSKEIENEIIDFKYKRKNKRRPLIEIENEVGE